MALLRNKIIVDELVFDSLNVVIEQNGVTFNFTDIINKFSDTDTIVPDTVKTSGDTWFFEINNISLNESAFLYKDVSINVVWDLNNITLIIPAIHFSNAATILSVNLAVKDGGHLSTKVA